MLYFSVAYISAHFTFPTQLFPRCDNVYIFDILYVHIQIET